MHFSAQEIERLTPWPKLVPSLDQALRESRVSAPQRHHHSLQSAAQLPATLLLMPAWQEGAYLGVKMVTVFPDNHQLKLPSLTSTYQLFCCATGRFLASFDGNTITTRRTAAASALASQYISRPDVKTMLLIGAGSVGSQLVWAHSSVRDIEQIFIFDQFDGAASQLAERLREKGVSAKRISRDALSAVAQSVDLISCATLAKAPVLSGDWVRPGTHVDLVGSFTPDMREADDVLMAKAKIVVDFRAQALAETGELIQPIASGVITPESVIADLPQLCADEGNVRGEFCDLGNHITVFKAVGDAREDLATAVLVYESALAEKEHASSQKHEVEQKRVEAHESQ